LQEKRWAVEKNDSAGQLFLKMYEINRPAVSIEAHLTTLLRHLLGAKIKKKSLEIISVKNIQIYYLQ